MNPIIIKKFITTACFLTIAVIPVNLQAQEKVTFDTMKVHKISFANKLGQLEIRMIPDSDTHFQIVMTEDDGKVTIYPCYSIKAGNIEIKKLNQLLKDKQIIFDGVVTAQDKELKKQSEYVKGNKISEKTFKDNSLFSEILYDKNGKTRLEKLFYKSGALLAVIQHNNKAVIQHDNKGNSDFSGLIGITEYYESGNVKRAEKLIDGNLFEKEHFTPTGQDTVFALPFMRAPKFPGGDQALMLFLKHNTVYPSFSLKHKIMGKVIVRFIVNKNGKVRDPKVTLSVYPDLDEEAIRVILSLPEWEPGIYCGEPVDTYFNLPISFRLSD